MSTEQSQNAELAQTKSGPGDEESTTPWVMGEPQDNGQPRSEWWRLLALVVMFGLLWYMTTLKLVIIVVGLLVSIFLHELGHFTTARWTGMKATQFFLFMGPRIWSFKRGETEYGVRSIPVGAFVRIVGMNNLDPPAPEDKDRAYMFQSYPRRMLVITAGSIMHFIQALVILTLLLSIIGVPTASEDAGWEINAVGGPAKEAGLLPGDKITAIDGRDTTEFQELKAYVEAKPNSDVEVTYVRAGAVATTTASLAEGPNGGMICISSAPDKFETQREGLFAGVTAFGSLTRQMVSRLNEIPGSYVNAVTNIGTDSSLNVDPIKNDCEDMTINDRPVTVVGFVRIADQIDGWQQVLFIFAVFNIMIGFFNLVPLLPLDGGHAALATYERLRSRKGEMYHVDANKLVPLTYAVVALITLSFIPLFILDVISKT